MITKDQPQPSVVNINDDICILINIKDRVFKLGHKKLLGKVIEADYEKNLYKIKTKYGVIDRLLSREEFDICVNDESSYDTKPSITTTLRKALKLQNSSIL